MPAELLVPANSWRSMLGIRRERPTRVKVAILNAVPTSTGGLHRWLHRGDVLALLYREAERLESSELRTLADRLNESTEPQE